MGQTQGGGVLDILKESWENEEKNEETVITHLLSLREKLHKYHEIAKQAKGKYTDKTKTWYDKSARMREFKEGEEVLILLPDGNNKLEVRWKGPFKVKKKMNDVNYMIELDGARKKEEVYHVNLLRKFNKENEKENHKDSQKRCLMISTSER